MSEGVHGKFDQNTNLRNLILATGCTTLAEASPRDNVWEIGLSMYDEKAYDQKCWQGANKLDKILLACQDQLNIE